MYFSSHSSTAIVASGPWPSAEAIPASMFAPNAFEAMRSPSVRERGSDQAGGGGLAVRAGDQDNLPVLCEHGQQPRLQPEPDDTADH